MSRAELLALLKEVVSEAWTADLGDGCGSGCCSGTAVMTKDGLLEAIDRLAERDRDAAKKQRTQKNRQAVRGKP